MVDRERMRQVVASVMEVQVSEVGDDASMDTLPVWDSLRQMNLVLALEEAFGISFPDDDAANATSFKLLVLVLEEQLAAG